MSRWWRVLPAVVLVLLAAGASSATAARPSLRVTVVQSGLDIPWDIAFLPKIGTTIPSGTMLYTERDAKTLSLRLPNGRTRVVLRSPAGMWSGGETGLMAVETAYGFASNREFMTCHGYRAGSTRDVRVVRWRFNRSFTAVARVRDLVTGLPSTSGRHAGCALVKGGGNILYVGTGDAATGSNPQNRRSGGGKVLRIDSRTGKGLRNNPYASSTSSIARKVASYGHRNVQGLARRKDGSIWSAEQGSYRDDEVNRVRRGGNYGWNPVPRTKGDPAYNEGADSPMTDYALRGHQLKAKWRSGDPTFATSGATFVDGRRWRSWNGALAVSSLKDTSLRLISFTKGGSLRAVWKPAALDKKYGRLRAAVQGPDGSLYLTTSNGGNDKILKVTPRSS